VRCGLLAPLGGGVANSTDTVTCVLAIAVAVVLAWWW